MVSTDGVPGETPDPQRLRLTNEAALNAALQAFARCDPAGFDRLWRIGGRPALRHGRRGLEGLVATMVGQQVSTASAAAIFARVATAFPTWDAAALRRADDDLLRGCGLSAAKMRTVRAIGAAVADGSLPLATLDRLPSIDAHARLVAIKGIGPWTADVFLLFCLGEPDAFPTGDLALQEAYRLVFGGDTRPSATALLAAVERWRPWRGVGAYMLWACYRALKAGVAATPIPE